jgi:hypothetical protein
VCRPCTERSLTGHDPRDREPAALNRQRAGHGGISRRKEDHEKSKRNATGSTGSSSLISDQREPLPTSSDSPRSLKRCLVRPAFFAEGDATREIETP